VLLPCGCFFGCAAFAQSFIVVQFDFDAFLLRRDFVSVVAGL
jgi:hypothetical protein